MKKMFLMAGLLAMSMSAMAGDKGNGGDAVVCRDQDGRITSAELLDYYEAKRRNIVINYENENEPYEKRVENILNSLDKFDPDLAKDLRKISTKLVKAALDYDRNGRNGRDLYLTGGVLFTNDELIDIPDSNHLSFKRGCQVEQFAIRLENNSFQEDPEFLISKEIWNTGHLSNVDRAGLILHEAIYATFGGENSKSSRYFNQKISEKNFSNLRMIDYIEILKTLNRKFRFPGTEHIVSASSVEETSHGFKVYVRKGIHTNPHRLTLDRNGDLLENSKATLISLDGASSNYSTGYACKIKSFKIDGISHDQILPTWGDGITGDFYGLAYGVHNIELETDGDRCKFLTLKVNGQTVFYDRRIKKNEQVIQARF